MKKIKEWIEKAGKNLTYSARRKRYFEKSMIIIKDYENLTKNELIIEYAEKKSQYEFQRNFLIGTMVTTFLAVLAGSLKTIYLLLISLLKNSLGVEEEIEKIMGILNVLGIAILVFLIITFIIVICFYFEDTRKIYKDLLILEAIKKKERMYEKI